MLKTIVNKKTNKKFNKNKLIKQFKKTSFNVKKSVEINRS